MLLLFHGLNNYYILVKSRYCLGPDNVFYFDRVIQTSRTLGNVKLNLKSIYKTYIQISRGWKPPLFFVTASPFFSFGGDKNIIIMSNLIYFAILLFATYGIGKILYNSKVGILSAFLVSVFPTTFAFSRVLIVDFALIAMVALTFYLFVLNKFDSFKFSLLTGVVIGLGSLTKQSYFLFLLPILFYFFLQKDNLKNKKIARNFIFSIILGSLIAATYYTRSSYDYYHVMFQVKNNVNPFFYFHSLLNRQLLPFFFLLFLASLAFYFRKRKYFLPVMIFILLILFSISPNKQDRFILPIFPYIAVMIAGFTLSLPKAKRIFTIILILFSFLQYFTISYGSTLSNGIIDDRGLFSIIDEGDWQSPCEEIIKIINDNIEKDKVDRRVRVLFIGQTWKIHTTINYLRIIKKLPLELRYADIDSDFLLRPWLVDRNFDRQIARSDFIIIEEISPENMWIHTGHLSKVFKRNFDNFNFIKTISFPDNSLCNIYKSDEMI